MSGFEIACDSLESQIHNRVISPKFLLILKKYKNTTHFWRTFQKLPKLVKFLPVRGLLSTKINIGPMPFETCKKIAI